MHSTFNFKLFKRDDLHRIMAALRLPGGQPMLLVLPMDAGESYVIKMYPTDVQIDSTYVAGMHEVQIKASQMFDAPPPPRATGATSRQMRNAPQWATFVCPNDAKGYYVALARHVGRADLTVVSLAWLDRPIRRTGRALVIDHAAKLDERRAETVRTFK
jgi:hypothetical protein